jgi:glycosyltransferase involved in cell wall biosynthesis
VTAARPIYFNGKFYGARLNGVHRVADRLIRECDSLLAAMPAVERPEACLMTSASATWVPEMKAIKRRNFAATGQVWEQFILPRAARGGVLVNLANLAPIMHRRKVTMLHDAQFLFPDCGYPLRQRIGYRLLAPLLGRTSAAMVTVSDYSRRMLHLFSVADPERVHVVPNGADHILDAGEDHSLRVELGLEPRSYAVMFGSPKAYKNNATVFAAFADQALAPTRLVVVGPPQAELESAGLVVPQGTVFATSPDDESLRGLLAGALCLLFPSLTEGFGLPPLEAMLCGCPAIVSPAGAIPEVCGDAVIYAAAEDPHAWRNAVKELRETPDLAARKVVQGSAHAATFTWSRAGAQLMQIIQRASSENS